LQSDAQFAIRICTSLKQSQHKILFICSSLEPGKDGVGDYTRKLAAALIQRGYPAAIIAVNDRHMSPGDIWETQQEDENIAVPVLRMSSSLSWNGRLRSANKFADAFAADWISLQYVPFGYHLKGLPFGLGKRSNRIGKDKQWHIMFHELSVNRDESLKFRLWAFLQVRIIRSLLKTLSPALVTTNTGIYKARLEEMGYAVKILPLFSNIRYAAETNSDQFSCIIPEFIRTNRDGFIIGTLFGSFDPKSWNLHSLLDKFPKVYKDKRAVITSIGRMPSGNEYWKMLQQEYPHILFLSLGIREPGFISYWLSGFTDFGILSTLPELAGKSSSFMAFKAHGVPVVCKEGSAELQNMYNVFPDRELTTIHPDQDFVLPQKQGPVPDLDEVADQFIEELLAVAGCRA